MDAETFVSVFGAVFEDSPWAAESAQTNIPFDSLEHVTNALCDAVKESGKDRQLALLRAHPELGSKKKMADASVSEQKNAGIKDAGDGQKARLQELNNDYRSKFDFPFIIAVKGLTPELIIEHMQRRLSNDYDAEFEECLSQVFRIARFRLDDILLGE